MNKDKTYRSTEKGRREKILCLEERKVQYSEADNKKYSFR